MKQIPICERLLDRRGSVPLGCDRDGGVVFGDDHDAVEAAAIIKELVKALEKARGWIGGYGHEHADKLAVIDAVLSRAQVQP